MKTGHRVEKDNKGNIIREYEETIMDDEHPRIDGWFLCIAPLERPQLAIAVIVEGGGYGSKSAAPIAAALVLKAKDWAISRRSTHQRIKGRTKGQPRPTATPTTVTSRPHWSDGLCREPPKRGESMQKVWGGAKRNPGIVSETNRRAREAGATDISREEVVQVCSIARFARSLFVTDRVPGVPLRSTPGFMLPPASRDFERQACPRSLLRADC